MYPGEPEVDFIDVDRVASEREKEKEQLQKGGGEEEYIPSEHAKALTVEWQQRLQTFSAANVKSPSSSQADGSRPTPATFLSPLAFELL